MVITAVPFAEPEVAVTVSVPLATAVTSPADELLYGLGCLQTNPIHQDRYERFIGPLVYHDEPASWDEALQTVNELAQRLLT